MRNFILVASIVLMAGSAHAGETTRGLALASNQPSEATQDAPARLSVSKQLEAIGEIKPDNTPAQTQPRLEAQPKAEAPAATTAPNAAAQASIQPRAEAQKAGTPKVEKPKRKRISTEARVISELHRYGIYW